MPLALEAQARRVLNWHLEGDPAHPMTPGMPYLPLELADAQETVRLAPFGFTHLRMAYVPVTERDA